MLLSVRFRILQITYSGSSQVFAICSFSSEIENTTAPTDSQVNQVLNQSCRQHSQRQRPLRVLPTGLVKHEEAKGGIVIWQPVVVIYVSANRCMATTYLTRSIVHGVASYLTCSAVVSRSMV